MASSELRTMLIRLWVSGPLLYIGLSMAIDPARFLLALDNAGRMVAQGIRELKRQLRGLPLYEPPHEAVPSSPGARKASRCAGLALAAFAFLYLARVVN